MRFACRGLVLSLLRIWMMTMTIVDCTDIIVILPTVVAGGYAS